MKLNKNNNVLVAMSGGVDSSTAALLLLEQGYNVAGCTMDTGYGNAPEQAATICKQLGIKHYIVDVKDRFEKEIIQSFLKSYLNGETPNPCIECNAKLKFPAFSMFFDIANNDHYDYFATGHYVQKIVINDRYALKSNNTDKDQSYFLYRISQEDLARCIFPLGELSKEEIRSISSRHGLSCSEQKDSYDICFINGNYRDFLREKAPEHLQPGDVVDEYGTVVGHHEGLSNYTFGQRRGLNIALGYPAHVLQIDLARNRLVVGPKSRLFSKKALITDCCFMAFDKIDQPLYTQVRIRHKAPLQKAMILSDSVNNSNYIIEFEEPVWGITPGQSAVFYNDDIVLGGGRIITSIL